MNQNVEFGAGSSNQNFMGFDPGFDSSSLMIKSSDLQTSIPENEYEVNRVAEKVNKTVETIRANRMMFEMIRDSIKGYVCKRDGLDINSKDWLSAGRMITKSEVLSIDTYQWTSPTEQAQIELIFEELSSELNERMFNVADGSGNGRALVKSNLPHNSVPVTNEELPNMLINNNPQNGLIQPIA